MANFGLTDLRLVDPRDGWPNPKAQAMAAGAAPLIAAARIYNSVEAAIGELQLVYATTARDRAMSKPVLTPEEAAGRLREAEARGVAMGILFGNERAGLTNDDVALADCVITIPTDEGFSSLNLGQAVLLVGYEWFKAGDQTPPARIDHGAAGPASREELILLFEHLEEELEKSGFLFPPGNRPGMIRNLRSILHRAQLTDQEVRTLRGVIVALTKGKRRRNPPAPKD
jgi:tRNA/rRNA methyltransferase